MAGDRENRWRVMFFLHASPSFFGDRQGEEVAGCRKGRENRWRVAEKAGRIGGGSLFLDTKDRIKSTTGRENRWRVRENRWRVIFITN